MTLFVTSCGSVVGSAISSVTRVCANPDNFRRMGDDIEVRAGRILEGAANLDDGGAEIFGLIQANAAGVLTRSEALGHREFILGGEAARDAGAVRKQPSTADSACGDIQI